MIRSDLAFVRRARTNHIGAIDFDVNLRSMRVFELAEFSFDGYSAIGDVHFDAGRHWNRFFTYAGHVCQLSVVSCQLSVVSQMRLTTDNGPRTIAYELNDQ